MLKADFIAMLCCPETRQSLALAPQELLNSLNLGIAQKKISNRKGVVVLDPLEAGLVRTDGQFLYPVRNGIPILLADEAIPAQAPGGNNP